MTWTIHNNDRAWGFLSADERQAFSDYDGAMTSYHYPSGVWYKTSHETPIIDHVYRAVMEPTPAIDTDQTAQLDTANARIAELEAANDDLRERYKAFACWAERKLSGIKTEEAPCSQRL
jgi:hypothetical protein